MLVCGIIEELEENDAKEDSAYFFCQATDARINTATAILGGLIFSLVRRRRSLLSHVKGKHLNPGSPLFEGSNGWIHLCEIFEAIIQDPALPEIVLIVDALDECGTDRDPLLRLVVKTSSKVKWLLSNESVNPLSLELKGNAEEVSQAVWAYIDYSIPKITTIEDNKELQEQVRDILHSKANGTFLWVALAIKQLEDAMEWEVLELLNEIPEGLESLYGLMMRQIESQKRERRDLCLRVLSIITTAYRPLRLEEFSTMRQAEAGSPQGQKYLCEIAKMCGSFLTVKEEVVYFVHQSAKDFMLEQDSKAGL